MWKYCPNCAQRIDDIINCDRETQIFCSNCTLFIIISDGSAGPDTIEYSLDAKESP